MQMQSKAEIEAALSGKQLFRVLSFGGGTQSAWLLDQHILGNISYDLIVFADTGAEPQFIHDQVGWWRQRLEAQGCTTPFLIATHGHMDRGLEEMLFRYILTDYNRFQMVAHCEGAGMLPRQCTTDFKITPVLRLARKLALNGRKSFPKDWAMLVDIGFAADEKRRAKRNQSMQYDYAWLAYPMIDEGVTVADSLQYLSDRNFPDRRSRCYFCPFQTDNKPGMSWREIIDTEPLSFLKACWFDEHLRGVIDRKALRSAPYLHHSRQPLKDLYADEHGRLMVVHGDALSSWVARNKAYIASKYTA